MHRFLQFGLELRQLAVLQFRHLFQLARALRLNDLGAHFVHLLLEMGGALRRSLFGLPDLFQVGVLALQFPDLVLDQREALLRGLVLFLLHRFALDLELDQAAVQLVHHFRLGIDLHLDARGSLVDQVDRLVRQEAVGDVAVATVLPRQRSPGR